MSTKIHNGYYSDLSLEKLLPKLQAFKPVVTEILTETFLKSLLKESVYEYDNVARQNDKGLREIIIEKFDDCEARIKKLEEWERPGGMIDCDMRVNCVLFPMAPTKTLILFYCDTRAVDKAWEALPFIFDYHYQNSCDRPEKISKRNWDKRIMDWNKVLGGHGYGLPAHFGYTYYFSFSRLPFISTRSLLDALQPKYWPSDRKRRERVLHDTLWFTEREVIKSKGQDDVMSDYLRFSNGFRKKLEDGQHKEALKQIELKPLIII